MLLRGNKQSHKIHDIMLNSPLSRSPHANTALPVRHSMTAKSKTRLKASAANKTISIRPEGQNASAPGRLNIENSSQMLPNSTFSFYNNQPALSSFDNLQLQDFLKYVIVGDSKVSEDKSQEIIRSLNGTWFKNTKSTQLPASKLYNNLGVRRARIQSRGKQADGAIDHGGSEYHFMKEYTPPNIFPGKKIDTRKLYPSRSFIQEDVPQKIKVRETSPLKMNILKRKPQSDHRINNSKINRSQSQFQKKKSMLFSTKNNEFNITDGLIKGTKMHLHRD